MPKKPHTQASPSSGRARKKSPGKHTQPRRTITGNILTTRSGLGFLAHPDFAEDIRIEQEYLHTALHGDTVEVSLLPRRTGGQPGGEVLRIIKRAKTQFVGTVEKENGLWYVVPDDRKMYTDILISEPQDAQQNQKVLVELTKWTDPKKDPLGKIVRVLGQKGEHEVEIASIVLSHNIDTFFPSAVAEEAQRIKHDWDANGSAYIEQAVANGERRDFRDITTFTIDPETAKDFDDALSIQKVQDGLWEIGIHIADVSHYVKPGTELDQEARARGFSVYLVDRTIPMLPEELSNDLCSLNPQVNRLAFSAVFTMDDAGHVQSEWFGKTVIYSDKRFSYEEAQTVIDTGKGPFYEDLLVLKTLSDALRTKRFQEGAIDFEQNEVEIRINEQGTPTQITRKERLDTHKLIEEFMLLANREVAASLAPPHERAKENVYSVERQRPGVRGFIYRVHDLPDQEKLAEIATLVRGLGFQFPARSAGGGNSNKKITPQDINTLFTQLEGSPIETLIKTAMIRSMAKAVYATKNIGHFGLGFKHYTHFTSPIRRYSDLIAHRLLMKHLQGTEIDAKELARHTQTAEDLSNKEIDIQKAERASITYKQVEYMAARVGEIFEGVITGVTEWGIYIEEIETGAEGMVRIRDLPDDYYTLEEKKYRLKGTKTKKMYTLGDRVKFKVASADLDRKTLDFVLSS